MQIQGACLHAQLELYHGIVKAIPFDILPGHG